MDPHLQDEIREGLLAAGGGLVLTAAFPKIGFAAAAAIALVPLLWAIRESGPGEAFRRAMFFGIAHFASLLYWLVPTMARYGGLAPPLAAAVLFLFAAVLSLLFVAPTAAGLAVAVRRPAHLLGALPLFWAGSEYLRSFLFTGFPWGLLGTAPIGWLPFVQIADLAGPYGITAVLAAANAAVFLLLLSATGRTWQGSPVSRPAAAVCALAAAGVAAAAWGYGGWRIAEIDRRAAEAPRLRVALIQGNIAQALKWDPAFQAATIDTYVRLSRAAERQSPELIVWPESAAPFYFLAEAPPTRRLLEGIGDSRARFLIGAPAFELRPGGAADYFNSAFLVAPAEARVLGRYDKAHLVPYGEYVPFKEYLPFLGKMVEHVGDFTPGPPGRTLAMAGRTLGIQICYEIIFPALSRALVRNGAELLITITNDAWYGKSAGPYQHFALAVLRAVETRRALARAANTGISAFIDPAGRVHDATPLEVEAVAVRELPLLAGETVYAATGDLAPAAALGISIGLSFLGLWRRRRPRKKGLPPPARSVL